MLFPPCCLEESFDARDDIKGDIGRVGTGAEPGDVNNALVATRSDAALTVATFLLLAPVLGVTSLANNRFVAAPPKVGGQDPSGAATRARFAGGMRAFPTARLEELRRGDPAGGAAKLSSVDLFLALSALTSESGYFSLMA